MLLHWNRDLNQYAHLLFFCSLPEFVAIYVAGEKLLAKTEKVLEDLAIVDVQGSFDQLS